MRAAALNFFDILLCRGEYQERPELPFTPGGEISGTVHEAGEGANCERAARDRDATAPARRIRGEGRRAGIERLSDPRIHALREGGSAPHHLPDGPRSPAPQGAIGVGRDGARACGRGRRRLRRHPDREGRGGAGDRHGRRPEKVEVCKGLGAEVAIDYREENFVEVVKEATEGRGADVIFDPVGGDVFDGSRRCVAFEGRIVVIGFAGGRIAEAPTNHVLVKNYSVVGMHWGLYTRVMPDLVRSTHEDLIRLYEAGEIDPLIYQTVPFDDLPQALNLLGGRGTYGKLIANPGD